MIDIVNTCDAVAALLDKEPSPTVENLSSLGLLRSGEPEYLLSVIPKVAIAVASLDETTPGKDTGIFRVGTRVLSPHSALSEPTKQVSIPMQILRSTGNASYETLYLARDGLGFVGSNKLRENSMVRIRLDSPTGPLEVLGVIVLCAAEEGAHRMEAKLFAAEPQLLRTWLAFYGSLV
jgi:hypothetical protein